MPKFVTLDLTEVRQALGEHYDPVLKDSYPSICPVCEGEVFQDEDECSLCGTPTVWKNSTAWKLLYGPPTAAIRRLSTVEPEDRAGIELCRLAGVTGFANQTEAKRWARAAKKLGHARMLGIARYAAQNKRGRGVIAHGLNLAEKITREEAIPKQKPRPTISTEEKQVRF